ncbi:class I SAM-dependent methyltransferase [Flavobacterium sp.]|uniref:class I SAM-dependent methyltransferase n=1 Tax=Flavobacterium sp. TaxID=239 RepID=UPI0026338AA6|nr:class I SAM-dependent methyltransferase [Flavobacterium sp.]MDD2986078.1 class I SAM-dependent methyltransferase [Flavobacterium sp.]
MTEFWEEAFKVKQEMWGFEPAKSTLLANDFFAEQNVKNVLIPGLGYGRNAQPFLDNGMTVTGIEISKTAIDLAQKRFGSELLIYHGSVTEMPFDNILYDGIYCYALIHLLDKKEREKLIRDCYNQLTENGFMVFTTVTKKAPIYGQGSCIDKDRYQLVGGLKMFFYERQSILEEFGEAGLFEIIEVNDVYPFYLIKCKKANN